MILIARETPSLPSIDFPGIAGRADLGAMVEAVCGHPRKRRYHCCFHEDHSPSLTVRDGYFRCWSCGKRGDAIDFLAALEGLSLAEAARKLDGSDLLLSARPGRRSRPEPSRAWQDPAWQRAVDEIIRRAEGSLWESHGRGARDWLHARGLDDLTIRSFRLGFLPEGIATGPLRAPRGITIPWLRPGSWYLSAPDPEGASPDPRWVGCNVRLLAEDVHDRLPEGVDKCVCLRGSTRGHLYPYPDIHPTQGHLPALIVEGEWDALIGWQRAGHLVHAVTVGPAKQAPDRSALKALARCPWWLLAFDHDAAGVEAARRWKERAPHKARRVLLPSGKDLNDFIRGGGDVVGWLTPILARLE